MDQDEELEALVASGIDPLTAVVVAGENRKPTGKPGIGCLLALIAGLIAAL